MSPIPETPANRAPAPLLPFAWHWLQIALIASGVVGIGAGLWQSTWWRGLAQVDPPTASFRDAIQWTNLAQLTLSAALIMGGTLMGARLAALRFLMLGVGWLGILYAVVGSTIYVWYLVSWASWRDGVDAALPGAWTGWTLAIALGLLGLGKLLFFIVVVGYFGRFDVRAYLEDPPAWFTEKHVSSSVKA